MKERLVQINIFIDSGTQIVIFHECMNLCFIGYAGYIEYINE